MLKAGFIKRLYYVQITYYAEMCGAFIWRAHGVCVPLRRCMNGINHACLVLIYFRVLATVWCEPGREKKRDLINLYRDVAA